MRALFAKLVLPRALNWALLPGVAIGIAGCNAKATRFSKDGYASRPASGQVAAAPVLPPMGEPCCDARAANAVPKLDVGPSCEAAAQAGRDKQVCLIDDEDRAKDQVTENWSQYRDADKQLCAS
jgi:hypothetical protein